MVVAKPRLLKATCWGGKVQGEVPAWLPGAWMRCSRCDGALGTAGDPSQAVTPEPGPLRAVPGTEAPEPFVAASRDAAAGAGSGMRQRPLCPVGRCGPGMDQGHGRARWCRCRAGSSALPGPGIVMRSRSEQQLLPPGCLLLPRDSPWLPPSSPRAALTAAGPVNPLLPGTPPGARRWSRDRGWHLGMGHVVWCPAYDAVL